MSVKMPAKPVAPFRSTRPNPLCQAAYALWLELLAVPVKLSTLTRITVDMERIDSFWQALSEFEHHPITGRYYWSDRQNRQEILGFGVAHEFRSDDQQNLAENWQQIQSIVASSDAVYLGGLSFSGHSGADDWEGFDAQRFSLPLLEIRRTGGHYQVSVQLYPTTQHDWQQQFEDIRQLLNELQTANFGKKESHPKASRHNHVITQQQWHNQVEQVLDTLAQGSAEKIVLARATYYELDEPCSSASLADKWQARSKQAFGFLFDYGKASFIGFSPERLLRQQGLEIATEALAGTQPRGADTLSDQNFEHKLRDDQKLIHEHELVSTFIQQQLKPFTRQLISDAEVGILKLPNVQHRQANFRAQINQCEQTPQLLSALFPTPAVCGVPKLLAYRKIKQLEFTDRGWYAGAVGYIGDNHCEFSVAIRSGLLSKQKLVSYAGAGIVYGSQAAIEWQELDDKSAIVKQLLS